MNRTISSATKKVEEIVDKRIKQGDVEYLVKWQGLLNAHNSWERAEDIDTKKVAHYERMQDDCPARNTRAACARRTEGATTSHRPKVKQEVDDDNHEQSAGGRSRTLKEIQGRGGGRSRSKSSQSRTRPKSKSQTRNRSKSPHPAKGAKKNSNIKK